MLILESDELDIISSRFWNGKGYLILGMASMIPDIGFFMCIYTGFYTIEHLVAICTGIQRIIGQ